MEPEIVVDELAATLEGALASLRAVAADALAPSALIAVERASSRRARARLAELSAVQKTRGELPPAFADLVEVDGALDELLARWERTERPAVAVRPWVAPVPVVVEAPVPVAAPAPAPAPAVVWAAEPEPDDEPAMVTRAAIDADAAVIFPTTSVVEDDDDDDFAYAASSPAVEDDEPVAEEEQQPEPAADLWAVEERGPEEPVAAPQAAAPAAANPWVVYEEQPPRDVYLDDDEDELYADPSSMDGEAFVVYAEPEAVPYDMPVVDDEPLPAYAAPKVEAPVVPVAQATKPKPEPKRAAATVVVPAAPQDADDWSFEAENLDRGAERYRAVQNETTRLEDIELAPVAAAHPVPDDEDDEAQTAVVQRPRAAASARPGAAAIQLGADGPVVLGAEPIDEHEDDLIELGDTRDYGDEEAMDDEETGILGVGVVEYDDDFEELEESVEAAEVGSLDRLPVLPTLSPAEIQALCVRAAEVGRKSMVDGAALYGDVLDAQPDRVDAMMSRGRLLLDLGDFPGAVSDFQKAEALHPRDADVQVALGDLFFSRKDYNKAVFYYNRALGSEADHVHALARRGMAHYYRKQFTAAVEDLERAKALDKTVAHVDSYIQRAKKRV